MIIGHEALRERLRRAVEKNRSAQAYLFVGPENVGKRAVALELAALLLRESSSRDVTILRPERVEEKGKVKEKAIGVEAIRDATRMLGLSNLSGRGKVLLVDDAHRLSEGAQNAFLKTLEEPFPGTTIVLVTHEEGMLLPTLLSRCERVSFPLVSEDALSKRFPDVPETLWRLGRPGLCVSFQESPESFGECLHRLESLLLFEALSFSDRAARAEAFSNDIPEAERMFAWWIAAIERGVFSAKSSLERRKRIQLLHAVSATLRDLRRFPGSARLTLEHLFFFRKSVAPLLARNISAI